MSLVKAVSTCIFVAAVLAGSDAFAQHEHHGMDMPKQAPRIEEKTLFDTDMRRMTGMVPSDPMHGATGWQWMTAGVIRFGYNRQGGERKNDTFESSNWVMGMAHHPLGPGRITFMLMNSLEPVTFDEPGSPELFQTGETFDGEPLVDFQHPHDFFMNISATARAPLGANAGVWLQLAPVGEPALGPVAFMHRASAGDNPSAPLGHHWQDATHVTSNVITAGAGAKRVSIDGSAFHGREPDEDRWDIDGGDIDSWSGRVTVELPRRWSAQVSHGNLHDHHTDMPGDVKRTTASIQYNERGEGPGALMLLWGRNDEDHGVSDSFLAEYARQFDRHQIYARAEWVQKDEQLLLTGEHEHVHGGQIALADVGALTLGYFHTGRIFSGLGMGGDVTVYAVPSSLRDTYGDFPVSLHVFIRARWMNATGGGHHH